MDPHVFQVLKDAGLIGALLFFIYGGLKGWWVFGRHLEDMRKQFETSYEEMRVDRDYWRRAALEGVEAAKESVSLAERRRKSG